MKIPKMADTIAVKTYAISIPKDISAARVIMNNNFDTASGRVHVRVNATKINALYWSASDAGVYLGSTRKSYKRDEN